MKDTMETKTCSKCKIEMPKTLDYFFKKIIKEKNSKGEIVIYNSFRHICKKCYNKEGEERRVKKRCKEMNCNISEYEEKWKEQYSKNRTKDYELRKQIGENKYISYRRFLNKGVSNFEEYEIRIKKSKKERNDRISSFALLKKINFTEEDIKKYRRDYYTKDRAKLKDSYIANNVMGYNVNQVSKSIIETRRLILLLKRELKNQ